MSELTVIEKIIQNHTDKKLNLDECHIDLLKGEFQVVSGGSLFRLNLFSEVQRDICEKGSLLKI